MFGLLNVIYQFDAKRDQVDLADELQYKKQKELFACNSMLRFYSI